MTMRARLRGVTGLLVLALIGAACAGTDGANDSTAAAPTTTPTGPVGHVHHHAVAPTPPAPAEGGAAGHLHHDATIPPLASRLADASSAQRTAAADLLASTRTTLAPFESEPAARAAGFLPNDATKRVIHYRNIANRRDGRALDPTHPEGLVYLRTPSGHLRLLGAVFTVRPADTAPAPGGSIFFWHTHDPSCGSFLVPAGGCTDTFRMLHVWTAPAAVDPWIQAIRDAFGRG
jgi:hypothetical protein